jgi:hypothetical protein
LLSKIDLLLTSILQRRQSREIKFLFYHLDFFFSIILIIILLSLLNRHALCNELLMLIIILASTKEDFMLNFLKLILLVVVLISNLEWQFQWIVLLMSKPFILIFSLGLIGISR